ncbi:hypothetical protein GCM10023107_43290 [Actinoplanes octamycinicus]|nr:hypothetical protein Aoc01nite_56430 [Actinoplanes octamycinicus]
MTGVAGAVASGGGKKACRGGKKAVGRDSQGLHEPPGRRFRVAARALGLCFEGGGRDALTVVPRTGEGGRCFGVAASVREQWFQAMARRWTAAFCAAAEVRGRRFRDGPETRERRFRDGPETRERPFPGGGGDVGTAVPGWGRRRGDGPFRGWCRERVEWVLGGRLPGGRNAASDGAPGSALIGVRKAPDVFAGERGR